MRKIDKKIMGFVEDHTKQLTNHAWQEDDWDKKR
jgi:hypothetical protein